MAKTGIKGPMRPEELGTVQASVIPKEVFDVFNEAIATKWSGASANIVQEDVIPDIIAALGWSADDRQAVFDNGYLNIEEAYRSVGWNVLYDKPGYNESYKANWHFTRKK